MTRIRDTTEKEKINEPLFTWEQLVEFSRELRKAGSFDKLMLKKEAIRREGGSTEIVRHPDREAYAKRHWTGVYAEPEHHPYKTDVPYVYWSQMYEELERQRGRNL
ncbi:hypothetical protein JYU16_01120 [bacterium AH-315-M05]|nr:hypothetical protein [bacterium AH-315-M05]